MSIWHPTTPFRAPPWQPQPVRKVLGDPTGAGGPTSYPLSGSITQAQSLTLVRGVALQRTVAQTQALSLRKAVALTRAMTQSQALSLRQAISLTRALTQAQTLSVIASKVFLRTVSTTQAQAVALNTVVHRTYAVAVSAIQAQVLSLLAQISMSPPPTPVVVPSSTPAAGVAVSNYLDWPQHTITSSDIPPPVGSAVGGP